MFDKGEEVVMDRKVFMAFGDFVNINSELLGIPGVALFLSKNREDKFSLVKKVEASEFAAIDWREAILLFGEVDGNGIVGKTQSDVDRKGRVGFVEVIYGGEDEYAIGATLYLGDSSAVEKKISKAFLKVLERYGHRDVVNGQGDLYRGYYWTDNALASGKNWHLFLGRGIRKEKNKELGYRPKFV